MSRKTATSSNFRGFLDEIQQNKRQDEIMEMKSNGNKSHTTEPPEGPHSEIDRNKSSKKVASTKTNTSSIIRRRMLLELDIKAARELAIIEAQEAEAERVRAQAEREKQIILQELSLEKLRMEEKYGFDEEHSRSDVSSSVRDKSIQNWINNINPVNQTISEKPYSKEEQEDGNKKNNLEKYVKRQNIDKTLPIFSGNPTEWLLFITEFNETTDACGFSDLENINRLRKCLRGEAREAVKMLLISHKNIPEIIQTLSDTYGRPEYVIKSLIQEIKLTPPPKEDKPGTLIKFACVVNNLVTAVRHLDSECYLSSPQLLEEVINYLPPLLKQRWAEHAITLLKKPRMQDLADWMKNIGKAASLLHSPKMPTIEEPRRGNKKVDTVFTTIKTFSCKICNLPHEMRSCKSFKTQDIRNRWKLVKEHKLCFSCLRGGHSILNCRFKRECNINNCKKNHHPLLHSNLKLHTEAEGVKLNTCHTSQEERLGESVIECHFDKQLQENVEMNCHIGKSGNTEMKILLRVLPVTLKGPAGEIDTYALLDEASTVTLIDEGLAEKLGLGGRVLPLCLQWTNDIKNQQQDSKVVSLAIKGREEHNFYEIKDVRTLRDLSLPYQTVNIENLEVNWPYLKKFNLKSLEKATPKILIGQDNWQLGIARRIVSENENSPVLSKTLLGWVLHGKITVSRGRVDNEYTFQICHHDGEDSLHNLVKNSFNTESFGVKVIEKSPRSKEELHALLTMEKTTRYCEDRRWETGLLWKEKIGELPDTKTTALRRLLCIERKMDEDKEFAKQYEEKIQDFVMKGYARKISEKEVDTTNSKVWYVPHFAVTNPNKPGKMRLVFDAAAKSHGYSLNDLLLAGPDLLIPLHSVLCKFRQKKIAFVGDIREMFPQIKIIEGDQAAQRFLWRSNNKNVQPETYVMVSMMFGTKCSPSSAQYVKNRNALEHKEEFPEAFTAITTKHYMDDYLDCSDSEEEAIELIKNVIEVHRRGSFNICSWISNSRKVLEEIPADLKPLVNKEICPVDVELTSERVLGLFWNPNTDQFYFPLKSFKKNIDIVEGRKIPTKREVLKIVMSIFDPLGFLSHFTVFAKILLQDIWRMGIGWDDEISGAAHKKWLLWVKQLPKIKEFEIPRCYSAMLSNADSTELHMFCDASEKAFAAVGYLRIKKSDKVDVAFVTARTRVAPLKPLTIPRLELQAAVMACRLAQTIVQEHEFPINRIVYWSDSRTVLSWIKSDAHSFKPFVKHRIGEISETSNVENWRWVPSAENVADEATKWASPPNFKHGSRWLRGPEFLEKEDGEWPLEPAKTIIPEDDFVERREIVAVTTGDTTELAQALPEISRFSKYSRLVRTTAWVLRFLNNCKASATDPTNTKKTELLPAEIEEAEKLWCRNIQKKEYPEELKNLKNGDSVAKISKIYQLSPVIDKEGIIRMKGRLQGRKEFNYNQRHPIILDPKSNFTKLLLQEYHERANHQGREYVLNEIRQKFWIPRVRTAVKKTWLECQECKNKKMVSCRPEMGPLPRERTVAYVRPFTNTGMDYFGPMYVTHGRKQEKRYGVLFTCMATRAIHLEIASSLEADATIMAIIRMTSRRGCALNIFSDNGTNLQAADKEIRLALENLDQNKITSKLASKGIRWHFIPPASPHMGGCWERLIRTVKTSLKVVLKERAPKEEILHTLLVEVEQIVNSRPLTYVSTDPDDPECLTPNHFLIGTSSGFPVIGSSNQNDLYTRKQYKIARALAESFWRRWIKEYLPTLNKRNTWHDNQNEIVVGDIVILVEDNAIRGSWSKGRVVATYPGRDGHTRVADVKTGTGIYRRPVVKLGLLDVARKD